MMRSADIGSEALEQRIDRNARVMEKAVEALRKEAEKRRLTEDALHRSEILYRAIVEDQTELICRFLPDWTRTFVNEAYCRYFGKDRKELLGRSFLPLIPEEDRARQESYLSDLSPDSPIGTIEHRVFGIDGIRWQQWTNRAIFDSQGRVLEFQSVGRDITAQKAAEEERNRLIEELELKKQESESLAEALQSEKDILQAIMENTSAHLAYLDPQFNFLNVNDAYVKGSGCQKEELIGRNHFDLFPNDENLAIFRKVVDTGEPIRFHSKPFVYKYQPWRGTTYWNWSLVPIKDGGGNVKGLVLSLLDVTESKLMEDALRDSQSQLEKRIEERTSDLAELNMSLQVEIADRISAEAELSMERRRFQLLTENAPFAMVLVGKDGAFNYFNPNFKELFGYELEEISTGREWFRKAFPDPDYRHNAVASWIEDEEILAPGEKIRRTFTVRCKDGTERIISFISVKLDGEESLVTCVDVTERTRVLQELRSAHQQLQDIIEFLPDATFVIDKDRRVIAWNRAIEELTGTRKCDIVGKFNYAYSLPFYGQRRPILIDLISAPEPEMEAKYSYLQRKGGTLIGEATADNLPGGKGAVLWAKASPLLDSEGAIAGAIESIRDITERKREEAELLEANEMLQALIRASPLAILTYNHEGKLQSWNAAAERIFGWSEREVLGSYPPFVPEDRKHEFRALIDIALQGKTYTGVELQRVRKDGSAIDISLSSAPIRDVGGRIRGIISVMDDISKKKAAERSLRDNLHFLQRLIDTIPNPIYFQNRYGRFQGCNLAYEKFVDLGKDEIIGKTVHDIYPKAQAEIASSSDQALFSCPGIKIEETTMQLLDGRLVDVISNKATYTNEEGALAGLVEVIIDITERKRVEDELRKAKESAEDAARAKADFLANMSHEIRTPLNAVIGMTGLLLDARLSPDHRDSVETIRSSGDTLLSIINDILDFSKIDSGKMELERQPFDLRSCIEESLELNAAGASEKGLNLAYFPNDSLPQTAIGDPTRLRQILVNLISNAVKFTEKGEVMVTVTSRPRECSLQEVHFAVKDSGIGISEEHTSRLFRSFSQIDASTSRKYGGTGLGLAICKRLVELMGGEIWVDSEPGNGSTFHFTILIDTMPSALPAYRMRDQPSLAKKRILVVDSNETNLKIIRHVTRFWSMRPEIASQAEDALDLARYLDFDIAILGTGDRGLNPLSMAAEIDEFQDSIPLIPLTYFGQKKLDDSNRFAGHLTKPIKPAQLYQVLMEVFNRKEASIDAVPVLEVDCHHSLRILLAEDNAVNQKVAMRMLKRIGYRADLAANGQEVLQALERLPYDVILMDVQMPEMDGFEATRKIRRMQLRKQPKIIAVTAYALEGDREKCLESGMDDYVSKPVQIRELSEALKKCYLTGEAH
jgi:PAS domain S-box-containing protein